MTERHMVYYNLAMLLTFLMPVHFLIGHILKQYNVNVNQLGTSLVL